MQVIRDEIQLCEDCMIAAVNSDFTGLGYHYGTGVNAHGRKIGPSAEERQTDIVNGLARLGPNLVPAFNSESGEGYNEFSRAPCACCNSKLHGSRHEFAILG